MSKLDQAIKFATEAHRGQMRKLARTPYILHPLEAAAIAASITEDEEVLCAVVLHDVVEDTDVTLEEVRNLFGERVADLVLSETENKRRSLPPEMTWKQRKMESIAYLAESDDLGIKIMWLSDKLSNMRSLFNMYNRCGNAVFDRFHQKDKNEQGWYYRSIAEAVVSYLGYTEAYKEYMKMVEEIFG
ncbi:MAG: bifunctional (p)ppGpp synthetase/guanosine-3',5'-bis(diphosphate) 3'-pyrophosphohydrolase [Clostridia bacterium]|nr:bifunctional (p)ppGpp synthetase/guanosine-3',5'-bis(diphosphate) 3'-pyrophosphohydrolase [Clostridia bacterium]